MNCKVHEDRVAIGRVRWTVYGGAFKYQPVCSDCRDRVKGQRGVDFLPEPGVSMGEAIASAESRRIDRGEL